jgi:hypothetical protein
MNNKNEKTDRTPLTKAQIIEIYKLRWSAVHPKEIANRLKLGVGKVRHCVNQLSELLEKQGKEFPSVPRNRVKLMDIAIEVVKETILPKAVSK